MDLLFKITTGVAEDKASIKDTTFKNHYSGVNRNLHWLSIKPIIRQVSRDKIIPFIGEPLYDDLAFTYNNEVPSPDQLELIELLQDAIAHYAIAAALPTLNVVISDMGIQESVGSEGTSLPVSKWRFATIFQSVMWTADNTMDVVLRKLEEFIENDVVGFALWKNDASYKNGVSDLFRSTSELSKHVNIGDSRRAYLALLPHIRRSDIYTVREVVCSVQYDRIRDGILAKDLTAVEKALLPYMQELSALEGTAQALPDLAVSIEGNGIKIISDIEGMHSRTPASDSQVERLRQQLKEDAYRAQGRLVAFLYDNVDDYPDFKASDCWIDPDAPVDESPLAEDVIGGIAM